MTDDTLRRLMVKQLEKAAESLSLYITGHLTRDDLARLEQNINNCLAIIKSNTEE